MKIFGTDYDGVIINIESQKAKLLSELLNKYWKVDKDEVVTFYKATGGTSRKYKFDYFYKKRFKKSLPDDEYKTIESEFSNLLKTVYYPKLSLLPGALDLLKFARSNFDKLFVSSGIPMEELKYLTALNGTDKYFDLVLGTNEKFSSKYVHFSEVKRLWNSEKTVFVADSMEDMKVAKNAGAIAIGVLTNSSEEDLFASGADNVCEIEEVTRVINTFIN